MNESNYSCSKKPLMSAKQKNKGIENSEVLAKQLFRFVVSPTIPLCHFVIAGKLGAFHSN